jgi:hypothetical protein
LKSDPDKERKLALLTKAFSTEDGTRAAYRAARLQEPALLAATLIERVADFQVALLARHSKN